MNYQAKGVWWSPSRGSPVICAINRSPGVTPVHVIDVLLIK